MLLAGGCASEAVAPTPSPSLTTLAPPSWPQQQDLVEIDVGNLARNRFYVDVATLQVGGDGVVRYVLVVDSTGGARNVTYEGIRCASGEQRVYATGADGEWSLTPENASVWRPIRKKLRNRHHLVLAQQMFCRDGIIIRDAAAGSEILRAGGPRDANPLGLP